MTLETELAGIVGASGVLTDADARARFEVDWTGEWRGSARAVVRPHSTAEVAAVLSACSHAGVPVVPQGGNTGLVGGAVPDPDGASVVLTTTGLIGEAAVDPIGARATVAAGLTLAAFQARVGRAGFEFGIDLAARGTATLGGLAATNAGGMRVLRHGMMRRQVAGMEAVLADGTVLSHLAGLEKDNTGYDLAGLLCGSEGTLAVITAVTVRLLPALPHRVTALIAWPDLATMVEGLARLRAGVPSLDAAEYVVRAGVELVRTVFGGADPFDQAHPVYLLVEAAGMRDPTDEVAAAVGGLAGVLDVAVATETSRRQALWSVRELHTEALARIGPPRKYDVSVPPSALAVFADAAVALAEEGGGRRCHHFGHAGDGNVHLNVVGDLGDAGALDDALLHLVRAHRGSISAEHGIGRLKRPWLGLSRTAAELATFRSIKRALDPAGLLNPGVLLPA